jgi:excisionase family DNA binding protein
MSEQTTALPMLLTVREVAHRLSCSESTVRRLIADHELEPVRLRRVAGASLRIRAADVARLAGADEPEAS